MEPHGQARSAVLHGQSWWLDRGAESSPRRPNRQWLKPWSSGAVTKIEMRWFQSPFRSEISDF